MNSGFFALISRMRHIRRWGLMRNSSPENIQEHSHMVAVLAHALALIRRDVFGGEADPEFCAAAALYHDASEIITGDLPTPIKYAGEEITRVYHEIEHSAADRLAAMLPPELQPSLAPLLREDYPDEVRELVKAADRLSAYIKCVEERTAGNDEFRCAERQTLAKLQDPLLPEVAYFLEHFMPAYELTLDELGTVGE